MSIVVNGIMKMHLQNECNKSSKDYDDALLKAEQLADPVEFDAKAVVATAKDKV